MWCIYGQNIHFDGYSAATCIPLLTPWGRDKMAIIFADDIFICIFFNENIWISIKMSLKFVPKGPINNISALVQIMDWHQKGGKPISEPMTAYFTGVYIRHPAPMSEIDALVHEGRNYSALAMELRFAVSTHRNVIFLFTWFQNRCRFHRWTYGFHRPNSQDRGKLSVHLL